jgi:threonylcarbamoyladenosine tRNA methylthiotransferase CDKAL1
LKSMGRRYLASDFLNIAGAFRANFKDLSLNTDIIVGFPEENDDDFKDTMDLIATLEPDKVNITRFSRRPGTAAARLYDMPDRIKKDRSRQLTEVWLDIAARRNRRYEDMTLEALVTECGRGGTMKARSANYTGIVIYGAPRLGSLCKVDVVSSNPFYLKGLLAQEIQ